MLEQFVFEFSISGNSQNSWCPFGFPSRQSPTGYPQTCVPFVFLGGPFAAKSIRSCSTLSRSRWRRTCHLSIRSREQIEFKTVLFWKHRKQCRLLRYLGCKPRHQDGLGRNYPSDVEPTISLRRPSAPCGCLKIVSGP